MKHLIIAAGCLAASVSMAAAQTAPLTAPTSSATSLPAAGTPSENTSTTALMAGKNSFTEAQARARLEKQGYTQVSALTKDDQSIWRGTAMKDAKSVSVAVDYQGHIASN